MKNLLKALSFKGRIGRKTYWLTMLCVYTALSLIGYFLQKSSTAPESVVKYFAAVVVLFLTIMFVATQSKRLHDLGKPAPWLLLMFAPSIASYYNIVEVGNAFHRAGTQTNDVSLLTQGLSFHLLYAIMMLWPLWLAIQIMFFRGQPSANRFGEQPFGQERESNPKTLMPAEDNKLQYSY